MTKIILTGKVDCDKEDGGRALIASIEDQVEPPFVPTVFDNPEDSCEFFVRLQSWDDGKEHTLMKSIQGKKVRVTIEVIE